MTAHAKTLSTAAILFLASGCEDRYDFDKNEILNSDSELEDVVHERMHDYIEQYCRVTVAGAIECE